jgi:DNA-binding response OmpR family regulator
MVVMSDKDQNRGVSIPGNRILVIDTDENIRQLIMRGLDRAGAEVFEAANSYEGLEKYHLHRPDMAIIDGTLPESGGWEACVKIRESSLVPVLMLISNRDKEVERGLACGASEFLRKPFSTKMLVTRTGSLLQQVGFSRIGRKPIIYEDGYLTVDLETHRVIVNGESRKLTPTENKLLSYLIFHAGRVRTFQQILQNVWGWAQMDNDAYIHVYISNLRRKIEPDPKNPRYLRTEHRVGYRFEEQHSFPSPS